MLLALALLAAATARAETCARASQRLKGNYIYKANMFKDTFELNEEAWTTFSACMLGKNAGPGCATSLLSRPDYTRNVRLRGIRKTPSTLRAARCIHTVAQRRHTCGTCLVPNALCRLSYSSYLCYLLERAWSQTPWLARFFVGSRTITCATCATC